MAEADEGGKELIWGQNRQSNLMHGKLSCVSNFVWSHLSPLAFVQTLYMTTNGVTTGATTRGDDKSDDERRGWQWRLEATMGVMMAATSGATTGAMTGARA